MDDLNWNVVDVRPYDTSDYIAVRDGEEPNTKNFARYRRLDMLVEVEFELPAPDGEGPEEDEDTSDTAWVLGGIDTDGTVMPAFAMPVDAYRLYSPKQDKLSMVGPIDMLPPWVDEEDGDDEPDDGERPGDPDAIVEPDGE